MEHVTQRAEARSQPVVSRDGLVVGPGDRSWDEARLAWNLAVDQWPAVVAVPRSQAEVAEVVRYAVAAGLRVAPQGTGHMAGALGDLADALLVKLRELRGVTIDAERRLARAEAGVVWIEVVEAAAEHGLAALSGSSPDVGVVGYTLGGGLSWLARKHGLASNHVTAIEVVTADGIQRRVDRDNDPDLFWALRGGGARSASSRRSSSSCSRSQSVYAGHLWFPVERAAEVLRTWRDWTETVPEEVTSVGRILQFPPIPEIPEPMRGNSYAVLQAIYSGDSIEMADRLLAPLRALGPGMDTFAELPMPALSRLHMDPEHPVPGHGDGCMLDLVTDETIDVFVDAVVGKPILAAEIRHLGGAVARPRAHHGAVSAFSSGLEPWESAHTYLNFAEDRRAARRYWTEAAERRLRRIKQAVDPGDVFRSSHPV
jgi:FAD binding domain/Berberine and berberine like